MKFLGTEISTTTGAHGEQAASATVDGVLRVFLGGIAAAKLFLRARKSGPVHGPRPASWALACNGRTISSCRNHAAALSEFAYWQAEVRPGIALVRTEYCAVAGCSGGEVRYRASRRAMFLSSYTCAHHVPDEDTVEASTGYPPVPDVRPRPVVS